MDTPPVRDPTPQKVSHMTARQQHCANSPQPSDRMRWWCRTVCFVVALGTSLSAVAAHAETRLVVYPSEITLPRLGSKHQLLVTKIDDSGRQIDVTREAKLTGDTQGIVAIGDALSVDATAAGQVQLTVEAAGLTATIGVTVSSADAPLIPSFHNDVQPILTRFGCNQGACHGKLAGQNGFRLSLRGYANEWDHDWITREFFGRRIDRALPAQSLLVQKPLGHIPHGGGKLWSENDPSFQTLVRWIEAGAPAQLEKEPATVKLEVFPPASVYLPGDEQQLLVRAHYDNGEVRDVTWLTQFFSNDQSVIDVSPTGLVKMLRSGESVVRVHFQGHVEVVALTIPFQQTPAPEQYAARNNAVDEHVMNKLASLRIPVSPGCDDATFLRRAMLDTIGTLPTPEEVIAFTSDTSATKREALVDSLLNRPEFTDFWTLQLCDLLQNRKERDHDVRGTKGVRSLHAWVREQVAKNRPWHELAADVLTAKGDVISSPQVGYYIVTVGEFRRAEESEVVASVAQSFLGTRVGCAKCHNHPLEKYTQDDYYHFAAFFGRVSFDRRDSMEGPTNLVLASEEMHSIKREIAQQQQQVAAAEKELAALPQGDDDTAKNALKGAEDQLMQKKQRLEELEKRLANVLERPITVRQPRTNQQLAPQPLDRAVTEIAKDADPRDSLVKWMIDPKNENFSGNMVNRLWKHFLGVGLVEPVDDLRASNPPSNRELWDTLRNELIASNYNLKHVMRMILLSRTYQLSSATVTGNELETRFYSHYYARRLPAEVLLDAISQSTGQPDEFPGYPVGIRAVQLPDPGVTSYFLSLFGRSSRVTACACERIGEVTLPQLLHLQCGDDLTKKLAHDDANLAAWIKAEPSPDKLIEKMFLATLSRLPTEEELKQVLAELGPEDQRQEAYRDLFWALLNAKEFAFNH